MLTRITFDKLEHQQKNEIYSFVLGCGSSQFKDFDEMNKYMGGMAFDNGIGFHTFWEDEEAVGTIGIVTREIEIRKEVFIVGINFKQQYDNQIALLEQLQQLSKAYRGVSVKLGLRKNMSFARTLIAEKGFQEVYKLLELKLNAEAYERTHIASDNSGLSFEDISAVNIKELQAVSNAAFLHSPNGGGITDEELEDILAEYKDNPQLAGVCYLDKAPAGCYTLAIKEQTGWIESIGVEPRYQGRGIGKAILYKAVGVLCSKKLTDIRLTVISSNKTAAGLYLNNGFEINQELAVWYERIQ